jgi:hypothetical protein
MRRLAPCFLALMCVFCANLLQPPSARAIPGPCWYGIDVLPWDWIDCNFSNPLWVPSLTDGDPVNLATGGEEYAAPADLTAYNPNGPSAVFRRTYYSRLAMLGLSSAGLSAGWVSNYDYTIVPVDKTYDSADGPITTHYLRPSISKWGVRNDMRGRRFQRSGWRALRGGRDRGQFDYGYLAKPDEVDV